MIGTQLGPAEAHAWSSYFLLSRELFVAIQRRLTAMGVSIPDMELLEPLLDTNEGGLRPTDLAQRAGWSSDRVAHHIRRLEKRDLVHRDAVLEDRRGSTVRLTPAGRELVRRARPVLHASIDELLVSSLSRQDLERFGQLCEAVLRHVRFTVVDDLSSRLTPPSG